MLVDENGRFLSQREHPRLALVTVQLDGDQLHIHIPEFNFASLYLADYSGDTCEVKVWDDTCVAIDQGDVVAHMFETLLGIPCRLVRYHPKHPRVRKPRSLDTSIAVSFADGYPLLVIARNSLTELERRADTRIPMDRFRPNVVISEAEAHEEDVWAGFTSSNLMFYFAKLCERCPATLVDQETGIRGKEPLRTLATYRRGFTKKGVSFGSYYYHRGMGTLSVGDEVRVF